MDPVTTTCGHNFCNQCIEDYRDETGRYCCPQCRTIFVLRPILHRNIVLAEEVEELNKTNPVDVLCDVCTSTKEKAVQTCLTCQASFCETHIEPHRVSEALRKHKLEVPLPNLNEKLCSKHQKALEIYCRTDQMCICCLCAVTEHRSHDMVMPDTERAERQVLVEKALREIKQTLQEKLKILAQMKKTLEHLKSSADKEIQEYEKTFTSLLRSIESLRSQVTEVVRDHEQREVKRAEELKKRLEKEIEELKRRNTELVELSQTDDDIHFLQVTLLYLKKTRGSFNTELFHGGFSKISLSNFFLFALQKFPSVQACSESEDTANTAINVHFFLEDLRENLSNLQKCLKEVSCWKFVNISKSDNKKVILVVMHHTLNPGHIVAESARFVEQKNVVGTVDLLFHENLGLLECQLNKQSLEKVFFFCKDHCMK
ncbi:TRI25 ligase, partial [Polypterus senegalus]